MTYNDIKTDMSLIQGFICCIIDVPGEKEFTKNLIDVLNNGPIKYSVIAFNDIDGKHSHEITKFVREVKEEYKKNVFMLITPNETFPLYHGIYNYIMLNNRLYINLGGSELNASFADISDKLIINQEAESGPSYYKEDAE